MKAAGELSPPGGLIKEVHMKAQTHFASTSVVLLLRRGYSRPRAKVQQHLNISESWFWRWQREREREESTKINTMADIQHTHTPTVHTWTLQSKLWQTITPPSLPLTSTRLHPHSGSDPLYEALAKVQKQSVIWRGGEGRGGHNNILSTSFNPAKGHVAIFSISIILKTMRAGERKLHIVYLLAICWKVAVCCFVRGN